jgi:hypothetical protein
LPRPDRANPDPDARGAGNRSAGAASSGEGGGLGQLTRFSVQVAGRVHAQVRAADGVSVVVVVGDTLVFGGSNSFTNAVDAVQHELMEGPCVTAMAVGDVVHTRRLGTGESRWPDFTARTAALALRGVQSTPLLATSEVIGSVNLYARAPESLDRVDPDVFAHALEQAERSLSSARLVAIAARNTEWMARSLEDRADVARAVGWVMDRYRMRAAEARILIGQLARQDGVDEATAARNLTERGSAP